MPSYWLLWLNQCTHISGYNYSQARYIPGALLKVLFMRRFPIYFCPSKAPWNTAIVVLTSSSCGFSSAQSLSSVRLFATPRTAAPEDSLSITNSQWCSNTCPLSWWCHPTFSSSVIPFSSAFNLAQHQGLFQWVSSLHQMAKVLELQPHHQSCQWVFRTDFLLDGLLGSLCCLFS